MTARAPRVSLRATGTEPRGGTRPAEGVPTAYRSLLWTYPATWRRRNADVVVGTLLEVHAARGRTRPTFGDRVRFTLDGARVHLRSILLGRSAISVGRPDLSTAPMQHFDQTGGSAGNSIVDEWSQVQANLSGAHGEGLRMLGAPAWLGMGKALQRRVSRSL